MPPGRGYKAKPGETGPNARTRRVTKVAQGTGDSGISRGAARRLIKSGAAKTGPTKKTRTVSRIAAGKGISRPAANKIRKQRKARAGNNLTRGKSGKAKNPKAIAAIMKTKTNTKKTGTRKTRTVSRIAAKKGISRKAANKIRRRRKAAGTLRLSK